MQSAAPLERGCSVWEARAWALRTYAVMALTYVPRRAMMEMGDLARKGPMYIDLFASGQACVADDETRGQLR